MNDQQEFSCNSTNTLSDEVLMECRNRFRLMTNPVAEGCLVYARSHYSDGTPCHVLSQGQAAQITNMLHTLFKRVESDKVKLNEAEFNTAEKPSEDSETIKALKEELADAKERNSNLQKKITKMACAQAESELVFDSNERQQMLQANYELAQQLQLLQSDYRKKCGQDCRLVREELDKLQVTMDRLEEENRDLLAQKNSFKEINAASQKSVDQAKLFVKVLLGIYPDIDIYYVRNILKELIN